MEVDFEEAIFGATRQIKFKKNESCGECEGSGAADGSKRQECSQCHGVGQVHVSQGFFTVRSTCPQCRGVGTWVSDPCVKCHGSGIAEKKKTLDVKIPPGVAQRTRLVLKGEGDAGPAGLPSGDLYVVIYVREHDTFVREGNNLHAHIEIAMTQAALGAKTEIETLEGIDEIEIPKGIQSGETIHIRKAGAPDVRTGKRGDMILHVIIKTPERMNKKQSHLLEEFSRSYKGEKAHLLKR